MGQPLTGSGHNALSGVFGRMIELSRASPPPTLAERLDRLARLRALTSDNEARFASAISADFGHRSATETAIAETLFVLGEIKHATQHLKRWIAPQRVPTQIQFLPGRNRLIPQPLGVAHVPGGADKAVAGGVTAPFGGVVTFHVTPGDQLPEGSVVATIEAMKLEAAVTTPCAGRLARFAVPDAALVEGADLLLVIQ